MDTLAVNLNDQYGKNQDVLVEGFVLILQAILIDKRNQWEQHEGHQQDFYNSLVTRKWNKGEAVKIQSRDITTWDTSLCSKWLRKFKWSPTQKLSAEERLAIVNLVRIRNDTKHTATSRHVTLEQFEENCLLCENSLLALKTDPEVIEQILENARDGCILDPVKLVQRIQETLWEYQSKNALDTGDSLEHILQQLSISQRETTANNNDLPAYASSKIQPKAQTTFPSLAETDIVTMRKYCLREKGFWTPDNIRRFLDLVEPNMAHPIGMGSSTKTDFNSNMYRIVRSKSHLATKSNLTSAILLVGYPNLVEKFDQLSFTLAGN